MTSGTQRSSHNPRTRELRRVAVFGLQFLPIFLALLWVYPRVVQHYQAVPLGIANFVMHRQLPATHIEVRETGGWKSFFSEAEGDVQELWWWEPFVIHLVYLNLVLVPALLLATPVPWPERLRLLGKGVLALPLIHALSLIFLVRGKLGLHYDPSSVFSQWLTTVGYISGQVFAAVLWAVLTWRFWFASGGVAPRR